jgi:hypothetical protein
MDGRLIHAVLAREFDGQIITATSELRGLRVANALTNNVYPNARLIFSLPDTYFYSTLFDELRAAFWASQRGWIEILGVESWVHWALLLVPKDLCGLRRDGVTPNCFAFQPTETAPVTPSRLSAFEIRALNRRFYASADPY